MAWKFQTSRIFYQQRSRHLGHQNGQRAPNTLVGEHPQEPSIPSIKSSTTIRSPKSGFSNHQETIAGFREAIFNTFFLDPIDPKMQERLVDEILLPPLSNTPSSFPPRHYLIENTAPSSASNIFIVLLNDYCLFKSNVSTFFAQDELGPI